MYANEETMCLSLTLTDWEKSKWRYKKRTSEKRKMGGTGGEGARTRKLSTSRAVQLAMSADQ